MSRLVLAEVREDFEFDKITGASRKELQWSMWASVPNPAFLLDIVALGKQWSVAVMAANVVCSLALGDLGPVGSQMVFPLAHEPH